MDLTGTLVPHLGNLTFLISLNTSNNNFRGVVPREFARLRRLKVVDFNFNALRGPIPSWFGSFSRLQVLYLRNNSFTGLIPPSLSNASNLENLDLSYNPLRGRIPRELGNLGNLKWLRLQYNQLSGFVPFTLFNLSQMQLLDLTDNDLSGQLPSNMSDCSQLRIFSLSYNNFGGSIPREMGKARILELLYLGANNLTGAIPEELGNLTILGGLDMSQNKLVGSIPPQVFNISTLQYLNLGRNKLSGMLPADMCSNLKQLEAFYLVSNGVYGSIPNRLYKCSALRILSLSYNKLYGPIPPDVGNTTTLKVLALSGNKLKESSDMRFVTSLTTCRYLNVLSMAENPLHGIIPKSIGNLSTSLQYVYFKSCDLRGRVPDEIGNLSNLMVLSFRGNQLNGLFPKSLRNLQSLQGLSFSGNEISGAIPNIICELGNLNVLYLSDNRISGAIPDCIENISTLSTLTLDFNKLSSNIPTRIKELQTLSFLNLAHNEVQGTIPESMDNMVNLEILDLSHNNLSGVIPKSLQKLRYLTFFNVSFNGLNGEIPSDGPFKNFTFKSFMFNEGLCGDPKYHVPPCHATTKVERPNMEHRALVISLGITSLVVLVVILACGVARYRRKGKDLIPGAIHFLSGEGHEWRVSYYELLAATNGYNESNLVGCGSFGSVYKGTLENGNDVAVKVFNLQLEGAFRSFEVECEVLRNLRHRNLCKVVGCCSNQDFKALVLEYMPFGNLEKWLYSHNYFLDVIQRINIMIDVACALEYLHQGYSVPVIHCDLKPSNILLDQNMTARLCDFGIAKLLGDGESVVQTMTLATLSYIAPEYGMGGFVSVKCDVYSYGIILMEVFTRKRPNDEIFAGNLSLRTWVKDSMPNAVINIIDSNLLGQDEDALTSQKLSCLSSIMELGLNCSVESPNERMSIKDVIVALSRIKLQLLAI
ncbi:probable LRR receptor-like serine/threonine-protein kinase at3g47570 [Phtheirospermum japonicum]|uniref:non-specific serine/threonine protein kinase n=1 Tax=Phtheirospermum japonicum TaxID=374723 RepID=A0A830BRD2_9LAMI|nr:probable LRR receptor-like serine/threonine-protein kinase at3g47570 [Phtheirospermum japonicum]